MSLDQNASLINLRWMAPRNKGDDETRLLGRALESLRARSGKTQSEAADDVHPHPWTSQNWGYYARGERSGIHKPSTQRKLTAALGFTPDDLIAEAARLESGEDEANEILHAAPRPILGASEDARSFIMPVLNRTRAEPGDGGALVYDSKRPGATVDFGWLIAPTTGRLLMADDRLNPRIAAGQLLIFDRNMPPRPRQICVVETRDGGLHVYEFIQRTGLAVHVQQLNPAAGVEFPAAMVVGVYAVRMVGD